MSLRRHWQVLLPWSVVIAYIGELYVHWQQLGNRLVIHFNASGVPNGWQSKDAFALASVLIITATLAVCAVLINSSRMSNLHSSRQVFAVYYGAAAFVGLIFWGLVQHNLHRGAVNMTLTFAAAFGSGALGYWVGRSRPEVRTAAAVESVAGTSEKNIIGIDVHREPIPFVVMLAGFVLMTALLFPGHGWPVALRVFNSAVLVLLGYLTLLTGAGFSYVISRDSVQVRGLFWSMRTIPRQDILEVDIQPVPRFAGYGIRFWGDGTAYYLGGEQTVRLKIAQQSLFLGSNRPKHLLKLLKEMMAEGENAS